MNKDAAISVLGAGSYGTALAIAISRNGHPTLLWSHRPEQVATLAAERCNKVFLPDAAFPDSLSPRASLQQVVQASRDLLIVVPSHVFADVLKQIKPFLRTDSRIAWATKGLDPATGSLLQDVAREILGPEIPLAALSGPTFAKELAMGLPTAISLASTDSDFARDLADLVHCDRSFRVYLNDDMVGLQLGGAVKNVIAIGAGLADGLGFGANARTALITRGLVELQRLGVALGARQETFMGMAGLGDLVLTCTDNQSRNRRFGLALGRGQDVQAAMTEIGQVVEGYRNAAEVHQLAARHGVEMPICEQVYQVLYQGKNAKEAAMALLSRDRKAE
ncbi:NAD(P)H-dependent glycerol-3-phosphate dehydrogenase [Oceanisphaera psychrotolerans]|uniref:Glycerol-3-phosphate dehydrogenase [NAD(P)+] n=1 Tax=Oceanisphaera psychrotolerans TaxID=1414654 RepID=A0A1J4QAB9_9GAMM|nr:NAD(P)H-dependent glycerol-3-phosphate dehydrogenase [Oceanisphaera psychrotolerans]OIN04766.1 glycerol-3-phosphate dehydrogenase [Oceanisphaera psychrotolerans]